VEQALLVKVLLAVALLHHQTILQVEAVLAQ
jgi:hypothetical protein